MDKTLTLKQLESLDCQYAFFFQKAGEKTVFKSNCSRFSSASIIKVPLLLAWVHSERTGDVDRSELCNLDDEPQVRGAGLSWLLRARHLPFQDVLLMMIALSDNLCTNLVIRRIGLKRVGEIFRDVLKLQGTALERKLMDYEARDRGLDNWITPEDCIRFYDLIDALEPGERAWVDSMLRVCQDDALLMRDIPRDTLAFRHKTGSIERVLHDWGYTPDCRIFLLTQAVKSEPEAFQVFGSLGRWMMG